MFGLKIRDTDCDFRLIRQSALDSITLEHSSGVICVELVRKLQDSGARFVEVPIHHYPRLHGQSQFFQLSAVAGSLQDLAVLWFRLVVLPQARRRQLSPIGQVGSRVATTATVVPNGTSRARRASGVRCSARRAKVGSSALALDVGARRPRQCADGVARSAASAAAGSVEERVHVRGPLHLEPGAVHQRRTARGGGSGAASAPSCRGPAGAARTRAPRASTAPPGVTTRASSRTARCVVLDAVHHGDCDGDVEAARRRTASASRLARTGVVSGRPALHERERVGRQVDADDASVLGEPRTVATRPAARVENRLVRRRATGSRRSAITRPRVAVPPMVVLGRGDPRVLLDFHGFQATLPGSCRAARTLPGGLRSWRASAGRR